MHWCLAFCCPSFRSLAPGAMDCCPSPAGGDCITSKLRCERNRLGGAGQLFKSMNASLPDLQYRATEKEGAFVERIVLQNRHHENKPLEISKPQYCFQVEIPS